jgi:uncharacterized membrane protein
VGSVDKGDRIHPETVADVNEGSLLERVALEAGDVVAGMAVTVVVRVGVYMIRARVNLIVHDPTVGRVQVRRTSHERTISVRSPGDPSRPFV